MTKKLHRYIDPPSFEWYFYSQIFKWGVGLATSVERSHHSLFKNLVSFLWSL